MLSIAPPTTPRIVNPVYSPLTDHRRCSHCGQHDHWQRLEWGDNPGGWFCACSPLPKITIVRDEMKHRCTTACALAGVA
jgi:hypothetical protein